MDIKASDVKALREKTGAGMMECKKALTETNGNAAEAEKLLKEKGLAAVEKRAGRATSEGRIIAKIDGNKAALIELTCETDFVAKNVDFIALGDKLANNVLATGSSDLTKDLSDQVLELATKIRENMALRRVSYTDLADDEYCAKYVHSDFKSGVIVVLKAADKAALNNQAVKDFAYDCCLHYAAFTPSYVSQKDVDPAYVAEQKEIFAAQVAQDPKTAAKPENVREGIIQGKIKKHLADICFMDQAFVKDDKVTVAKKLESVGKEAGTTLSFSKIVFFQLGA